MIKGVQMSGTHMEEMTNTKF